jgi:hypothetical protein
MPQQGHQTVIESSQENLALPARSDLNAYAASQNLEANAPGKIHATYPIPDAKLNFTSSEVLSSDGSGKSISPVNNNIPTIPASTWIDFQLGTTNGATFIITLPVSTFGLYRRCAFSLLSNGDIQANFSIEAASIGTLANAGTLFSQQGLPLGWADLECTNASGKFKTIGSATNIIENSVSGTSRIHRFGSGAGGSSAGGAGSPEPYLGFELIFSDDLNVSAADPASFVQQTNASYSQIYKLACDKTKTVTTSGTNYTINSAPNFVVKQGDVIFDNASQTFRAVATVLTLTTGTLDAAFTTNLAVAACQISQAVYTKDLVNVGSAPEATRARDLYPNTAIGEVHIDYEDSLSVSDEVSDFTFPARISCLVSSSGLQATVGLPTLDQYGLYTRPTAPTPSFNAPMPLNANMERLFLCFIPNPNNITVSAQANLLSYEVSFYKSAKVISAGSRNSAFCFTDSSVTPVNCNQPTVVSSKTRVQLNFPYDASLYAGLPQGHLDVIVNGSIFPKYISGVTTDGYWKPIDSTTIELDQDYSPYNYSVEVVLRSDATDMTSTNPSYGEQDLNTFSNIDWRTQYLYYNNIISGKAFTFSNVVNGQTLILLVKNTNTASAVTFTDAGDLVTLASHGLPNGAAIAFSSIASTTGISIGVTYYVINATLNTFQLALIPAGAPIALTTNGTGVMCFIVTFPAMLKDPTFTGIVAANTTSAFTFLASQGNIIGSVITGIV